MTPALHPVFVEGAHRDLPTPNSAEAPRTIVIPSLREIWDLDGRIEAVAREMREAELEAGAPYREALALLQAKRTTLFETAVAMDAPPEALDDRRTLRIEVPTRLTPRTIDDTQFVRLFPEHLARCASVKIKVLEAEKVLSEEDLEKVLLPQETVYGDPRLVLVAPKATKGNACRTPLRQEADP